MNWKSGAIVICDRDYFPLLFSYRQTHPHDAFKIWDPESFLDKAMFRYEGNPYPALLRLGYGLGQTKKVLRLLRRCDHEQNEKLNQAFDALPKECVAVDPTGEYELKRSHLYFLEMDEDIELHRIAKDKGYPFDDISLSDLGIEKVNEPGSFQNPILFRNKFEQFHYVFSSIREQMARKDNPLSQEDIRIQTKDGGDAFYLRLFGDLYGIKVHLPSLTPLRSKSGVSALISALFARKTMVLTEEEGQTEEGKTIQSIIDEYELTKLPFHAAYACLLEASQSKKERIEDDGSGIPCGNESVFIPKKEVYLTCFQHGVFYKVYADDDVLPDATLVRLGLNPSYVKTQLEHRKKKNYLLYTHLALISRVKEHLDEKIYDSQLMGELCLTWAEQGKDHAQVFTPAGKRIMDAAFYDAHFVTSPRKDYRTYDSRFQGIQGYRYEPKKNHYSITHIDKYMSCPYAFYLGTVLPIPVGEARYAHCGTMAHKVLEDVYLGNYDLDEAVRLGREEYKKHLEGDGIAFSAYDAVLMDVTEAAIRRNAPLMRKQRDHAHIVDAKSEYGVTWSYGPYTFHGFVDNIILFGDDHHRYYVVNDYKTGAEKFRPYEAFLGRNLQLPSYAYALKNGKFAQTEPAKFAGMGIKTIMFGGLTSFAKDKFLQAKVARKALATNGIYLQDEDFWRLGDNTAFHEKKDAKTKQTVMVCDSSGEYLSSAGKYTFDASSSGEGHVSLIPDARPYSVKELLEDAEKATIRVIEDIHAGKFPIAPTSEDLRQHPSSDNIACRYCTFKNICYRVLARDQKDLAKEVADHFAAPEE